MSQLRLLAYFVCLLAVSFGVAWVVGRGAEPAALERGAGASHDGAGRFAPWDADERDAGRAPEPTRVAPAHEAASARRLSGLITCPAGTPASEHAGVVVGRSRAEVGRDGSFSLELPGGFERGALRLEARFLYLEEHIDVDAASLDAPVVLEPLLGGRLVVRLERPAGDDSGTIEGVRAELSAFEDGGGRVEREAHVGEDGAVAFDALRPGLLYSLALPLDGFVDVDRDGLRVFAGRATRLDLPLERGVRIAGQVRAEDGAPVGGARVTVQRRNPVAGIAPFVDRELVESDEQGRFALFGMRPGELVLLADAEGVGSARVELGERREGESVEGLVVTLRGVSVHGIVRWPDGSPAAEAQVRARSMARRWSSSERGSTDEGGRFELSGLPEETFVVHARATPLEGGAPWGAKVEGVAGGGPAVELVLAPGDRVTGVVVDDRGSPLERFTVRARLLDAALAPMGAGEVTERFRDDSGRFDLPGLGEGAWDVRAEAREHADGAWQRLHLPEELADLTLVLRREATLAGQVVWSNGAAPGEQAEVAVRVAGEVLARAKCAADGSFELDDVPPGVVLVVGRAPGWRASAPLELELAPAERRDDLRIVLRAGARLTGEVDPSIEDASARKLLASPVGSYEFHTALCDEAGRFAFEGLEPGSWRVGFDWRPSGGAGEDWVAGYQRRAEEVVELEEGLTTHVVLGRPKPERVRVIGRVTSRGAPSADHIVYVVPVDDREASPLNIGRTDAQGAFELVLERPGPYRFTIGPNQGRQAPFVRELPAQAEVQLEFELPTAALEGRVTRADGAGAARQPLMLQPADAPEGSRALGDLAMTVADEDGRFQFGGLPAGEYLLRTGGWGMSSHGLGVRVVEGVWLAEGETGRLDLRLEPAAALEGGVLHADGRPAADVTITLHDAAGHALHIWSRVASDATGAFRFPELGAGEVVVAAEGPDGARAERRLTLAPGAVAAVTLILGG